MSCRRGPRLRRRWAEFPLARAGDGRADVPDTRPFAGRRREDLDYTPTLEDQLNEPERRRAA